MQMRQAMLYASCVLFAGGCTPQGAPAPAVDLAAEEQAVRDVSMEWLAQEKAKNASGISVLFADDGTMFRENRDPIAGPAAIEAYTVQYYADNPSEQVSWTTDRVEVAASGDMAVEYGTWTLAGGGAAGTESDNGKYVTAYRKVNGQWKVVGDMSVSTKPDTTPPAP